MQKVVRLEEAIAEFLEHRRSPRESDADFLARHASLRDLLEPMLSNDPVDGVSEPVVIDDFKILREVGRGGMGVVYEARQCSLDRRVALKILRPGATLAPATLARFKREAKAAARLRHPCIVSILETGEQNGLHWFAMEYLDGGTIAAAIRPSRATATLVADIADALQCAHAAGIVHRDVKPDNIVLRRDGTPVLTDFGLAHEDGLPSVTRIGTFAGTPFYVSPEQALGRGVDGRSDVFSLGVTLYELITGRRPFQGDSTQAVLQAIATAEPMDPRRLRADLPGELAAIVLKAIEKDPHKRYASAQAFATDLRAFLADQPISARRPSRTRRILKWARRAPARAALAATLALGIPTVALLAGIHIANAPLVSAGERKVRADQGEELLRQAVGDWWRERGASARQLLTRALDLRPGDPEAIAGVALSFEQHGMSDAGATFLANHAAALAQHAALRRLHSELQAKARGESVAAFDLARANTAVADFGLDLFIEGLRARQPQAELPVRARDVDRARRAVTAFARASRLGATPRLFLYEQWAFAANEAQDKAAASEAATTIEALWGVTPATSPALGAAWGICDPRRAAAHYQRLEANDRPVPEMLWHRALACAQAGDEPGALQCAQRLVELLPESPYAHDLFATYSRNAGQDEAAMAAYSRAFELGLVDADSRYELALLLSEQGDPEGARANLQIAIEAAPDKPQAHNNMGWALHQLGRNQEAMAAFQAALRIDPDMDQAHRNLLRVARIEEDLGAERAEHVRWAQHRPRDAQAQLALAENYLRQVDAAADRDAFAALLAAMRACHGTKEQLGSALDLMAIAWQELGVEPAADWLRAKRKQ